MKLYPGISPIAASRMERIAGSYASMSNIEQQAFTTQLREARKRGAKAKAVTKGRDNVQEETPVTDGQEAERDEAATRSPDSEINSDTESENAGG